MKKKLEYKIGQEPSSNSTMKTIQFIQSKYEFMNNTILNEVLFKEKGRKDYSPVNPSTLYIEVRQAGLRTTVGEINTFLSSDYVPSKDPLNDYFESVKNLWISQEHGDYIEKFSSYIRVKNQERFAVQFKKWLVRCVACVLIDDNFNKQALIFVHDQQNSGKTTLTRFIVPPALNDYQVENISTDKDSLISLCQNFIVIQDELSTLSKTEVNAQKSLMSKAYIKVRHPYDRRPKMEPRRASIIGSTNKADFLTDETGTVRWLCFTIEEIDWNYKSEIDINLVWSQAYHLFQSDFKCEMTAKEIAENEQSNNQYRTLNVEMELILKYYSQGTKEDNDIFYTSTDICENLTTNTEGKLKINPVEIGKALKTLGFVQSQKRGYEDQQFPVKGYYIKLNNLTTYYNQDKH